MNTSLGKNSKSLFLFYILVTYIFLQFISWSYVLFKLNNEVYQYKSELILYKSSDSNEVIKAGNEFLSKLHKRWAMILGEGSVFLFLLTLGIIQIRKTFKKEAELATQQKNFLLSITHELKSPIASAKLQLETLQKRELDKNMQQNIISGAIADTERLNNLVENILLAAQIDNKSFSIRKEKINVSEYIHEVLKTPISIAKQTVEMNIEKDISLDIDKMTFPSMVLNLFENAVKYSSIDSTIKIAMTKNDSKTIFKITDEGIGITDREKALIFNKFYRVGNEDTRNTKGTGLGLYIVKYISEQHNGTIIVKDNSPKGSIFEIIFNT